MPLERIVSPQGLTLLNQMRTYANDAFIGQMNPQTNQVQHGAVEIHYDMQHLATLDVTACTGSRLYIICISAVSHWVMKDGIGLMNL